MERETRLSCSLAINGITCRKLNVSATSASARSRSNFATKLCFVRVLKPILTIKKQHPDGCLFFMERETRLELATPSLARKCSTTELLSHSVILIIHAKFYFAILFKCAYYITVQHYKITFFICCFTNLSSSDFVMIWPDSFFFNISSSMAPIFLPSKIPIFFKSSPFSSTLIFMSFSR